MLYCRLVPGTSKDVEQMRKEEGDFIKTTSHDLKYKKKIMLPSSTLLMTLLSITSLTTLTQGAATLSTILTSGVDMKKILGGAPLSDVQPKANGPRCPLGCSAEGKCEFDAQGHPTCLCGPGFIGTGCQEEHYQGYALLFNGKQSVDLPPMGTSSSLTISFWMRATKLPTTGDDQIVYRSTKENVKGTVIITLNSEGRLQFVVHGNKPSTAIFQSDKHSPIKTYEWHHIGITYAKRHAGRVGTGSTTLYLHGTPVETLGYSGAKGTTVDVNLRRGSIGSTFHGVLDEVALFDRANTPEEMKKRPYGRLSGKEANIIAYYRFDEGGMDMTRDHTPVDPPDVDVPHDGTLSTSSPPTWVVSWAPFESCVLRCSMQGRCEIQRKNGILKQRCACFNGYEGEDCEIQLCRGEPGPCSGHGQCVQKKAREILNYVPEMPDVTSIKKEATMLRKSFESEKILTKEMNKTVEESIHNLETETERAMEIARNRLIWWCDCQDTFAGETCSNRQCPGDCSGHGECGDDGECVCSEGFRGIDCAVLTCPNDCSNKGQCLNGTCACDAGYSGDDCGSVNICPNDCSGHGKCENRCVFF